jgi:hypothetical protein
MNFIETDHGCIPASRIVRITTTKVPGVTDRTLPEEMRYRWLVEYESGGGDVRTAYAHHSDFCPDSSNTRIVPAVPGYFVVQYTDEAELCKYPVVAWSIEPGRVARPVCTCELLFGSYGLLAPDGTVDNMGYRTYATLDAFREHEIETPPAQATTAAEESTP